jgi:hypothetical protein
VKSLPEIIHDNEPTHDHVLFVAALGDMQLSVREAIRTSPDDIQSEWLIDLRRKIDAVVAACEAEA